MPVATVHPAPGRVSAVNALTRAGLDGHTPGRSGVAEWPGRSEAGRRGRDVVAQDAPQAAGAASTAGVFMVGREQVRYESGRPVAISDVLVPTSATTFRTADIALGTPTCLARSRRGAWALYATGSHVVVVYPGGAVTGEPGALTTVLPRLLDDRRATAIDRAAICALGEFLAAEAQPAPRAAQQPRSELTARDDARVVVQMQPTSRVQPWETGTVPPVAPDQRVSRRAA